MCVVQERKVFAVFSVALSSVDKRQLEQVEKYAISRYGCKSGGIVEEALLDLNGDVDEVDVPRSVQEGTFYEIYGILRSGVVGYVGITSVGTAQRVNQHLKKAEMSQDEFVLWLAEGLEKKDIQAGVIKTCIGKSEAMREEQKLIRKLHPLFNKRDGEYGLVGKIGGVQQLELE